MSNSYQGIEDNSLPLIPKPSLQQYENFQIYHLVCVDEVKQTFVNNVVTNTQVKKQQSFLAIQAYSTVPIIADFVEIVNNYP